MGHVIFYMILLRLLFSFFFFFEKRSDLSLLFIRNIDVNCEAHRRENGNVHYFPLLLMLKGVLFSNTHTKSQICREHYLYEIKLTYFSKCDIIVPNVSSV